MRKAIAISLIVVLALVCVSAMAVSSISAESHIVYAEDGIHVSDWNALKSAVKSAANGSTIILDADIRSSGGGDDRIKIDGKELTIDLNGHNVDRNRNKNTSNGHAFEIQGNSTVTITSSSEDYANILGGYADHGGAVNIHEGSTVTFNNIAFLGNRAGSDGGAIYNRGHLIMVKCFIYQCEASDTGGAIYNEDTGWFELDNVKIEQNKAKNDGGAMNLHLKKESTIRNSTIQNNKSQTEDGGAISLDKGGKFLSIYDTVISGNECEDNGGGIDVENGSVKLYGVTIRSNTARNGGGIYFDGGDGDVFEICEYENATIIEQNTAFEDGGGLYNKNSDVILNGGQFTRNVAGKSGGALRLKDGTTTINGTTFDANSTIEDHGGAIYLANDGVLNLNGGTFNDNFAAGEGGAILFSETADKINIQGAIKIEYNGASIGNDIYLCEKKTLTVVGSLEGSSIGVYKYNRTGTIAKGYAEHNDVSPSAYFFANDASMGAALDGGNVVLSEDAKETDPYLTAPFVSSDQLIGDVRTLSGNNWMSGISGDRYLNEFNIPGTHDTAMRRVSGNAGALSSFGIADKYAITQYRYIYEQYEEGVRYVDIRLHNRYVEYHWYKPNELIDDGENLWQCHGKQAGGTYWAGDEDDNLINLNMVLEWTKDFLTRNPSECIIMGFTEETYRTDENPIIRERLYTILSKFIEENPINPSTGNPYIYLENGDLGQVYTSMPQLKDVRGMILLETDDDWSVGGFHGYKKAGMTTAGQKTDRKVWWYDKRDDVNSFFENPEHQLTLPRVGEEWEHAGTLYKIGLNCAPQGWKGKPQETPLYHSDRLLPELFFNPEGCFYDIKGKYIGWVKTDGATGREWGKIWRSNFWQDESDFPTITVNPNLNDSNYQIKEYKVVANTTITIPDFNYDYDERANDNYFQGWRVGETVYAPGDTFKVTGDTTFVAVWSNAELSKDVSISIEFRDCNNVDGFRPSTMNFTVNGSENIEVKESESWHYIYNGILESIVPDWDRISGGENGTDSATGYRYELTGDVKSGFTFTFIHTSTQTYDTSIVGSIIWSDSDDYDKMRPGDGELTIALVNSATKSEVGTHTFSGGDWTYDFGSGLPKYHDGKAIAYKIVVKDSSTWENKAEYSINQIMFNLTAFHEPTKANIAVNIRWLDEASSRPESVVIHIKADGVEVLAPSISETEEEDGKYWYGVYLLDAYAYPGGVKTEIVYSISVAVEGYEAVVSELADHYFDILLQTPGQAERLANVDHVIELIDAIGDVEYTKACIARIAAAREAFDALSDEEKLLVYNEFELVSAEREFEQKFAHLVEIDEQTLEVCGNILNCTQSERVESLNRLGNLALDLEDDERNWLFNKDTLNQTLLMVSSWQYVINTINAIGDVTADADCKSRIDTARTAYNALSDEDKPRIENYDDLIFAEAEYFAKSFLGDVKDALATAGASLDVAGALVGIWNEKETPDGDSFREKWDALTDASKALLRDSESEDSFVDFRAKYAEIMSTNSATLHPFNNGPAFSIPSDPEPAQSGQKVASWVIALVVIGVIICVAGLVALFVVIYRKNKRA